MVDLRYERPTSMARAVALLLETPEKAAILAGGTDLLVALRSGTTRPRLLLDIKGIPGIDAIRCQSDGTLILGAAATVQQVCDDPRIRRIYPALAEGAGQIGSLQIRHRATIGGNLANASPCMDTAPPLLVLGARLRVAGSAGEREIPIEQFFLQVKRTALQNGEILASIVVPPAPPGLRTAFAKIKRVWGHDLALVNAAGAFDPGARTLRVAVGSCGVTPILLPPLTDVDPGAFLETGRRLTALADAHLCPIDDVRASSEYRRDMAALLCRRLAAALGQSGEGRQA